MSNTLTLPTVRGLVRSISVFGNGQNSAEIVVSIGKEGGEPTALRVGAYPATEPQVFSTFGTLLAGAYLNKLEVEVHVLPIPHATPQIVGIVVPCP